MSLGAAGLGSAGLASTGGSGLPIAPAPAGRPVLFTDNGYAVKRQADGSWQIVWSGSGVGHAFEDEIVSCPPSAAVNDPLKITTIRETQSPELPLYTLDGGDTWVNGPTSNVAVGLSGVGNVAKDDVYNVNQDEDGIVWQISHKVSDSHKWLVKSTDSKATDYVGVVDLTALGFNIGSFWISDGWVWSFVTGQSEQWEVVVPQGGTGNEATGGFYELNGGLQIFWNYSQADCQAAFDAFFGAGQWLIQGDTTFGFPPIRQLNVYFVGTSFGSSGITLAITGNTLTGPLGSYSPFVVAPSLPATPMKLDRVNTSGGAYQSTSLTAPGGMTRGPNALAGYHGTGRLLAWQWGDQQLFGSCRKVLSIDVSNPAAPSWAWSSEAPFGGTTTNVRAAQALFEPWDMLPISHEVVITNVIGSGQADPSADLHGSIWRSVDGGLTWTEVVSDTSQLGVAQDYAHDGYDNEISAIAVDARNPNDIWVALSVPYVYHSSDGGATWEFLTYDGPSLGAAGEWTGICVGSSPSVDFPGLARFPSKDGAALWGPPL